MVRVLTAVTQIPADVQKLIDKREQARSIRDYAASDQLRDEIQSLGFTLNDTAEGVELMKIGDESKRPAKSYLVLFGSGEIAPSSVVIYRELFLSMNKRDLNVVLLSTPAGFQPNVETVYGEIKDYLLSSLPDFNLQVKIIFANDRVGANDPSLLKPLSQADIIMLGPGSPTFAARILMGSLALELITNRVGEGSSLILASAATLAFSRFCLPVYEIYKAGADLYWEKGLDLYRVPLKSFTVIPHFNNREGGDKLDTSYCFMGKSRGERLLEQLPTDHEVLGVDEHTAVIFDLGKGREPDVRGKGTIHRLRP